MSRIARIFMWVLLLAAIFVAVSYFLPRTVYVERSARIEASPKTVYAQIIDLHQWKHWSTWNRMDPEMEIEYSRNGVGAGAGYKWRSDNKKVGNGSLQIVEAAYFDSIRVDLDFDSQGVAQSAYYLKAADGATHITWNLSFDVGNNPFMRWMGLMITKSVGEAYDIGLDNLNARCKVLEDKGAYIVLPEEVETFTYASTREKVPNIEISLRMGEMYGEIGNFLADNEVEMAGMPFAFYHLMNEEEIDLECGIPTAVLVEGKGSISSGTFPKTKCAVLDFYGDYRNLGEGHAAVQRWLQNHGFTLAGAPTEFYLTDPGTEPDPEKWLTRICYPVE